MLKTKLLPLTSLLLTTALAPAQRSADWYEKMDYGPYLSLTSEGFEADNVALKGRAIFLSEDSGVLFDTELLRVAAMWVDGKLLLKGTAFDGAHGPVSRVWGTPVSLTRQEPGWAMAGSFEDSRPIPHGPLSADHGRFRGLYVHEEEVVLEYDLAGTRVLEHFTEIEVGGQRGIIRELLIDAHDKDLRLNVSQVSGAGDQIRRVAGASIFDYEYSLTRDRDGETLEELKMEKRSRLIAVLGGDLAPELGLIGRLSLTIPAASEPTRLAILHWDGKPADSDAAIDLLAAAQERPDLEALTNGGAAQYPQTIKTVGHVSKDEDQAYVLDTITIPATNPWGSYLRFAAFDFIDADSAALSTWNGDVWIVDGIDADLDELTWRRFATGLHDPLGLKVVDGKILTHGRDQITRLHDLNDDGEADYYETFNNDVYVTKGFHEFAFDLQTDQEGNFYFSKGGPVNSGGRGFQKIVPHHGTILKLSPDGKNLSVYATGLRAPNGIGVSPDGSIVTSGDNEGTWMPKCRINWMKPGAFAGVIDTAHRDETPTVYDDPLCWLPMSVDNSGGGQVWVTSDRWGPLQGEVLHQSYGTCNLYLVLEQFEGEKVQGGVVRFPLSFDSSQMRARFSEADGQLYVTGFKGWQTRAAKDTAFQRVRYTGKPLHMARELRVEDGTISVSFSEALDAEVASDPESWEIEHWNYAWTDDYGSPEVSVVEPERKAPEGGKNRDPLSIESITVSSDGKTVHLKAAVQRVMQMRIGYSLDSKDGKLIEGEIHNTVNFLGKPVSEPGK